METEQPLDETKKDYYFPGKLTQAETEYTPYAVRQNPAKEACASCRWFQAPMDCFIVCSEPLAIMPTGWCNRWEALPEMQENETVDMEVIDIETDTGEYVMEMAQGSTPKRNPLQRLTSALGLNTLENAIREHGSYFKAYSDGRWIAAYTNNFKDREGEILSEAAHDRYIGRLKAGLVPYPELWDWHVKGTRHGQAEDTDRYGHMVIAIGRFDDTPMGRAAKAYHLKHKGDALSHGFTFPAWALKDGVYADYNTFEISTLPRGKEANRYTTFEMIERSIMTPEQRERLLKKFGADALSDIEDIEQAGKAFAEAGAKYKDFADTTPPETKKAVTDDSADKILLDLLIGHGETMKAVTAVEKGVSAKVQTVDDKVSEALKEMRTAIEAFQSAAKEMRAWIELKPKGVDETRKNVVDDKEADKAKESMVAEYDPAFPGLKVPLHTNGRGG